MTLREKFRLAKYHIKNNDLKTADYYLEHCLAKLSTATLNKQTQVEGISVDLWKTRVWRTIEKAGLLPQ
jgi:hypothetical protein